MEKSYITENYLSLIDDIKKICSLNKRDVEELTIVAVSKTFPAEDIDYLRNTGHIDFGENKVQEMKSKYDILASKNIRWHLIGHLQTNKIKYIASFVHLIHSVDSFHLAEDIDKFALKNNRIIDILVQVNTSGENQKFGIEPIDTNELCEKISGLKNVNLKGLMTIGMFTDDEEIIRNNFKVLKQLYDELKRDINTFEYLSMGMTSDYKIAIEEGSNMLRIGSAIFGMRNYK